MKLLISLSERKEGTEFKTERIKQIALLIKKVIDKLRAINEPIISGHSNNQIDQKVRQ